MRLLRSIRLRLTLFYVALLAIVLAAFCAGTYLALRDNLIDSLDENLETRAELLLGNMEYQSGHPTLAGVPLGEDPEDTFARVFDASGEVTFDASRPLGAVPVDSESVQRALNGENTIRRVDANGLELRVRTVPIERGSEFAGVLEVGLPQEDVNETLSSLLLIMAIAYPVTLLVASLGGLLLGGSALSPIDKLTGIAQRISAKDLSQRLNLDLPDDELGRLARTFDDMIARLDEAFRRQRQFTADASHELRTPLTAIKGQSEVALQRDRTPEAYRQALISINEEVDRMIRLTGSLLSLARADAGQIVLELEPVDLADVVQASSENSTPAVTQKQIQLHVEPGPNTTLTADEGLLIQLMLNLLDNAVKHTPEGGDVTVSWHRDSSGVLISVRDTGAGIAPEHLPHIFDRFYRADQARSRNEGGAGLGLSISRWIAEAHGGSIAAQSKLGQGATFTVRLPLSP